jgi:hypothetical protein
MEDWTSFLFTGSTALPTFMVLVNEEALGLALLIFAALLIGAFACATKDEDCPARKALEQDLKRRARERKKGGPE